MLTLIKDASAISSIASLRFNVFIACSSFNNKENATSKRKQTNQKPFNLKTQRSTTNIEIKWQSDDVKQYVQLREQYKDLVNDLSPNGYIIKQTKRFKSEKEDLKSKYETLWDEYDSLIEQHSLLKIENEEFTILF